jgi:hypothetical protein
MRTLAQSAYYPRRSAGLGSSPMATKPKAATAGAPTLGQQLIRALVPKHFPTMVALQNRSGLAYSTLANWKNGSKAPEWMVRLVMEQRRGCFLGASEQSSGL